MNTCLDKRSRDGYTIELHYDEDPMSPRDWDNLSELVMFHRQYNFPNDGDVDFDDHESWREVAEWLQENRQATHIHAVYMIDHSGIAFRVGRNFADCDPGEWDSGQVGLVYTTPERIGVVGTDEEYIDQCLTEEVEQYGQYVNGEVYGYVVLNPKGEHIDSCWGYFGGDLDYMWSEAESAVDYDIERREEAANDIAADAMQNLVGRR